MPINLNDALFGQLETPESLREEYPELQRFLEGGQLRGSVLGRALALPEEAEAAEPSLVDRTRRVASTIARSLVPASPIHQAVQAGQDLREREEARPPSDTDWGHIENAWTGIREGALMLAVGAGSALESLAEHPELAAGGLPGIDVAYRLLAETTDFDEVAKQYGQELRRQSGERFMELAQNEPQTLAQEIIRETLRMTPLVLAGTTAAVATRGTSLPPTLAGFAAVFGTSYPTEMGFLQNELEESGMDPDEARIWAGSAAVPMALTESLYEATLAGRVGRVAGGRAIGAGVRRSVTRQIMNIAGRIAEGGIVEGGTEAIQEAMGITAVSLATGEVPTREEVITRMVAAARAGALGGGTFGGAFGFAGEAARVHQERVAARQQDYIERQVADFDPVSVDPGTQIGNKILTEDSAGRRRWRDVETSNFAKAPSTEEVRTHYQAALTGAEVEARVEAEQVQHEPTDIPVSLAAQKLMQFADHDVSSEAVALNVRRLAAGQAANARSRVENLTTEEVRAEQAELETIALDPSADVSFQTRVTALARKQALDYATRERQPGRVETLDYTIAARELAEVDDIQFQRISNMIEARGGEHETRLLREARAVRESGAVESEAKQVTERLQSLRDVRSRGLTKKWPVMVADQPATIQRVRPSGFLDVVMEETGETQVVDPANVKPILRPGLVRLNTGEVVQITEVAETEAQAVTPDGREVTIPADGSTVDVVAGVKSAKRALKVDFRDAVKRSLEEERTPMPGAVEVTDKRTGQKRAVVAVGDETVATSDGDVVARENVEVSEEEVIPTFEPGTQPSEEGRHINFAIVPEEHAELFERAVKEGTDIQPYVKALHLLPQPQRAGTRMYAIELPSDARELTGASKKVLGFLGGKNVAINSSTLQGRVRLSRPLAPEEVRVMRVPEGLRADANSAGANINQMGKSDQREYLRRLTDLGFAMDPEVTEAVAEIAETSKRASDARIAGRIGEAEVAEIEVQLSRVEAMQALTEKELSEQQRVWDAVKDFLRETLTEQERTVVDVLNASTEDQLQSIPGVGKALAARIAQRASERGFTSVDELSEVQGLGARTIENIKDVLASRSGSAKPGTRFGAEHEAVVKALLRKIPGRRGSKDISNWQLSFEHPQSPGMYLVIDKETVPTATQDRQAGERDIYHIRHITPEGQAITARTIGHQTDEVRVPREFVGQAQQMIAEGQRSGRSLQGILDEMDRNAREVEVVELAGQGDRRFLVLDETGDQVTVHDMLTGREFQVDPEDISARVDTRKDTVPVSVTRRLTDDEVLHEVAREIRRFDSRATIFTNGEWRSTDAAGLYADIRPRADGGYMMMIFGEPVSRVLEDAGLFSIEHYREFATQEEATAHLSELGFVKTQGRNAMTDRFRALPDLESITDPHAVQRELADIIEFYVMKGYTPQPVRDYAARFALMWHQQGLRPPEGGMFGSRRRRRAVGVFDVSDARAAAQHVDPGAVPIQRTGATTVEGGTVVVHANTPAELASDVRGLDGLLLSPYMPPTHPARMEIAKQVFASEQHQSRFIDMIPDDGVPIEKVEDIYRRLVRVDGQLGVVIDSRPGDDNAVVQVFRQGKPVTTTVPKSKVTRVRSPDRALDYYRAAKDALHEITNLPVTPEVGASPRDARLGLDLVTDRVAYMEGLRQRVAQALQGLGLAPDGNINGDPTQIDVLTDAWIRMKELGISNRALPEELTDGNEAFIDKYGTSLAKMMERDSLPPDAPLFPPTLVTKQGGFERGLIPGKALEELSNTFSTESPYGDLLARAKLGMLSIPQRKEIEAQAESYGVDTDLPLYRKIEFLMQNVWDPQVAHLLFQMRHDMGALLASEDAAPPQGLELRSLPMANSIHTNRGAAFTFPREMANRHPTFRLFFNLAMRDRTDYGNAVKRGVRVIRGLMSSGRGMTLERKQFIWGLLENDVLGDAMERPGHILTEEEVRAALPDANFPAWNWYEQYLGLRTVMNEARRENIWNNLVRGFHIEPINFEADTVEGKLDTIQELRQNNDITQDEYDRMAQLAKEGKPVYMLDRNSNALYARPRSEVKTFLDLQEEYFAWEDIPAEIRADLPEWMGGEYNFWARYGINNYVPQIVRGRHKIYMIDPETGEERYVASAPDATTYLQFVHRAKRGEVEGVPMNADFYPVYGHALGEWDGEVQFLGSERYRRLYARVASTLGGKEGKLRKLSKVMSQELRIGSEPAAPKNLHTQARMSEVADVIEDPYERALIYWVRVHRNSYLMNVENSYETAKGLDRALSRSHGVETVYAHGPQRMGGHAIMSEYMDSQRDSFMGKPGRVERHINHWIALLNSVTLNPAKILKRAKADPNYDMLSDPEIFKGLYNEDYTAKAWAQDLTAFQSMLRLGLNMAGAAINALQHISITPIHLISRGDSVTDAYKYSLQAYYDGMKYWRAVMPGGKGSKEGLEMAHYIEDAGVSTVPARGLAGPGLGITGEAAPLFFSDDTSWSKALKVTEWITMLPFAKAERSVRVAATLAARRSAEKRGLSYGASVEFARDIVDNTQFQYFDQALPQFMRGPLSRVLMQFKPFVFNALKLEKDLIRGSLPRKFPMARAGTYQGLERMMKPGTGKEVSAAEQTRKALLAYNAMGMLLGGALWQASRPALMLLNYAWRFANDADEDLTQWMLRRYGTANEQMSSTTGTYVGDPELFEARNAVLHGIPGLFGIAISNRLGVSGLELDPTRLVDLVAGPSGALYIDTYKMLLGEGGFKSANKPAVAFGIPLGVLSQYMGGRFPLGMLGGPLLGTWLSSLVHGPALQDYAKTSEAGEHWAQSVAPRAVRGIVETIHAFDPQINWSINPFHLDVNLPEETVSYDTSNQERRYTGGLNKTFESLTALFGFQTIRSAQERAVLSYERGLDMREQELRRMYLSQIVNLRLEHGKPINSPEIQAIIAESVEAGLITPIKTSEIDAAVERARRDPYQKSTDAMSRYLRGQIGRTRR